MASPHHPVLPRAGAETSICGECKEFWPCKPHLRERIAALEAELEEAAGREGELQMRGNEWARRANSLAADNGTLKRNVLRKHKALEKAEKLLKEWNHRAPSKRSAAGLEAVWAALDTPPT